MKSLSPTASRIRDVQPFSACSDDELAIVANNTNDHRAAPGAVLAREGRIGREWIVIVSGSAVVRVCGSEVARLGPGDVIGEVALLDHGPRTATVVADTEVEALVSTNAEFDRILTHAPSVTRSLLGSLARRVRAADELITASDRGRPGADRGWRPSPRQLAGSAP